MNNTTAARFQSMSVFMTKFKRVQQNLFALQQENQRLRAKMKATVAETGQCRKEVQEKQRLEAEMEIHYAQAQSTQDRQQIRAQDLETRLKQLREHRKDLIKCSRQQKEQCDSAKMVLAKFQQLFTETEAEAISTTERLESLAKDKIRLERALQQRHTDITMLERRNASASDSLKQMTALLVDGASRPETRTSG
ncbi:hypothetical protein J8273_5712 [Carpediemonas membranifera]|uniref:Uncharacterized protein n=1 Tax=Carpediemonas membranifera TaxID=201153 RepID=A0A8J6AUM6_9EUKA|nr:hypothetical protein J8273_5712 [Carpediemonas membranifera]|eukprot:KAG9392900.1 hypothetical protein J8273_5712 [Carpediemonas membranifera]